MLKDPGSRSGIILSVSNPTGCFFSSFINFCRWMMTERVIAFLKLTQYEIYIYHYNFLESLEYEMFLFVCFHVLCFKGALFWVLWDTRSAGVNVRAARDQVECATGSWSAKNLLTWSRRRGPSSSARHTENKQRYIRNIIHIDR